MRATISAIGGDSTTASERSSDGGGAVPLRASEDTRTPRASINPPMTWAAWRAGSEARTFWRRLAESADGGKET